MNFRFGPKALLVAALIFPALAIAEEENLEIRSISKTRSTGWVFVDNGWKDNIDLLKVRLRNGGDKPVKIEELSAYFFDGDDRKLEKIKGVSRVEIAPEEYQSVPKRLKPREQAELLYAIAPSIDTGAAKWRLFVFEAKTPDGTARLSYPKKLDDFSHLAFSGSGGAEVAADEIDLEIKSVSRFRNSRNASVDGGWAEGLNTLKARIRLESGAESDDFFVRAYFFDKQGKQVLKYREPPLVENSRSEYQSLPPRWENGEEYEIFFPIPAKFESGAREVASALIVFGNPKTAVAAGYPDLDMPIDELDFPEKSQVQKSRQSLE